MPVLGAISDGNRQDSHPDREVGARLSKMQLMADGPISLRELADIDVARLKGVGERKRASS